MVPGRTADAVKVRCKSLEKQRGWECEQQFYEARRSSELHRSSGLKRNSSCSEYDRDSIHSSKEMRLSRPSTSQDHEQLHDVVEGLLLEAQMSQHEVSYLEARNRLMAHFKRQLTELEKAILTQILFKADKPRRAFDVTKQKQQEQQQEQQQQPSPQQMIQMQIPQQLLVVEEEDRASLSSILGRDSLGLCMSQLQEDLSHLYSPSHLAGSEKQEPFNTCAHVGEGAAAATSQCSVVTPEPSSSASRQPIGHSHSASSIDMDLLLQSMGSLMNNELDSTHAAPVVLNNAGENEKGGTVTASKSHSSAKICALQVQVQGVPWCTRESMASLTALLDGAP